MNAEPRSRGERPLRWGIRERGLAALREVLSGSRRGIEDTVVSLVPQAVNLIAGVITAALIARGLGPIHMGEYALVSSVAGLAALLSDLGIGGTAVRFTAEAYAKGDTERQLTVLRWAFRARMLLAGVTSGLLYAVLPFLSDRVWHAPELVSTMRLGLLVGLFGAIASVPLIYYQSMRRFKATAAVSISQTLLMLFGILALAASRAWTVERVIAASVLASFVTCATIGALVPRDALVRWRELKALAGGRLSSILKLPGPQQASGADVETFAAFMVISTVIVQVTMRADVWLIGAILEPGQNGLYSIATKFTLPLAMVLGAMNTALWPRAAAATGPDAVRRMLTKSLRLTLVVTVATVGYAVVAPVAAPIVFGSAYAAATPIAQVLCLRFVVAIIICPVSVLGYSLGLVRSYWIVNVVQFVVVVGVNLVLLPRWGAMGAAAALVANELIGGALTTWMVRRALAATSPAPAGAT